MGLGSYRRRLSWGPKAGPSIALLDLDPFFLKNHRSMPHVQDLCLETEIDRYEKTFPSSTPSVFSRTPTMEEFVCHGGSALLKTLEIPQSLAFFPTGANLLEGFLENSDTRFLSEESEIRVYYNLDEPVVFTMEASQENGKQLAIVIQDEGNPNFWNSRKYEVFSKILGFSTIGMEKEILKYFQNLRTKREKILVKELPKNFEFERELKRLHFAINYERGSSSHGKANSEEEGGRANDSSKRKVVKALLRFEKIDIFCLQEIKMRSMTKGILRSLGTGRFLGWEREGC